MVVITPQFFHVSFLIFLLIHLLCVFKLTPKGLSGSYVNNNSAPNISMATTWIETNTPRTIKLLLEPSIGMGRDGGHMTTPYELIAMGVGAK